jgi:hypothetical protein
VYENGPFAVALSGVNTHCAQALFVISHSVQLPPDRKQASKRPSSAFREHAPCAVAIGGCSATGLDAPTLLGMQAPGAEDAAARLFALPPLVTGWDGLQPPLHMTSANTLVVTTARIVAVRLRSMYECYTLFQCPDSASRLAK